MAQQSRPHPRVVGGASPGIGGKRHISDAEIEATYGIPKKTLQNWRLLGKGPIFRKFGRGVRYEVRLLEVWIEALPTGGNGIPSSALRQESTAKK
jgi:hypothetical protein